MYPPPPYSSNGFYHQTPYSGFVNQPPPYYAPPVVTPPQPYVHPVLVTTTQLNVLAMPQAGYRDYMGLSILNLLICCLPIGLVALLFSSKTRKAVRGGEAILAAHYSITALKLNIMGIMMGTFSHIAWIGYLIYYISTSHSSHSYGYYG